MPPQWTEETAGRSNNAAQLTVFRRLDPCAAGEMSPIRGDVEGVAPRRPAPLRLRNALGFSCAREARVGGMRLLGIS
ncbi:hypothetical protein WME75_39750 [Sorangium sp. So ce1014]|uniref:hypothetical protein n=1 Tax=Sorangium sp. So ce1014 TaxID=3133326 RepID=UPI003F5E3361